MQRRKCHICDEEFAISIESVVNIELNDGHFTCKNCLDGYAEGCYNPEEFNDIHSEDFTPFLPASYNEIRQQENTDQRARVKRLKAYGLFSKKDLDYTVGGMDF
jgi:hypothetical protein